MLNRARLAARRDARRRTSDLQEQQLDPSDVLFRAGSGDGYRDCSDHGADANADALRLARAHTGAQPQLQA